MLKTRTPYQKWRARRAIVLWAVDVAGIDREVLGDVFDLRPTRVRGLVYEVRASLDELKKAGHRDPLKRLLSLTEKPRVAKTRKRRRSKKQSPRKRTSEAAP